MTSSSIRRLKRVGADVISALRGAGDKVAVKNPRMAGIRKALHNIRNAPSPLVPLTEIADQSCVCCGGTELGVSRYPPFATSFFSGLILAHCLRCGCAWVPVRDLDLEDFYVNEYAENFRKERMHDSAFYDPKNPAWQIEIHKQRDRAKEQASTLARFGPFEAVLDVGAGEGFFLHFVDARDKYACELDKYCVRILQSELGVTIQQLEDRENFFDLVMASHMLEHFTFDTIKDVLENIMRAMKPGAYFHLEVPPGANQLAGAAAGVRPSKQRLEPHTLFFSSYGMALLVRAAGFHIVEASKCTWTRKNVAPAEQSQTFGDAAILPGKVVKMTLRKPKAVGQSA